MAGDSTHLPLDGETMFRFNPVDPVQARESDDVNDELDFLFNNFFQSRHPVMMPVKKGWKPRTDVYETEEEVVVVMDIAGIEVRDFRVDLDGSTLVIRGVRREPALGVKRTYHKMEIDFGLFERRIEMPAEVEAPKVTTNYHQGFLEIRLKKTDKIGPKRIEIEVL